MFLRGEPQLDNLPDLRMGNPVRIQMQRGRRHQILVQQQKFQQMKFMGEGGAISGTGSADSNGFFLVPTDANCARGNFFEFVAHGFRRDAQPQRRLLRVGVNQDTVAGLVNGFGHGTQNGKPAFVVLMSFVAQSRFK